MKNTIQKEMFEKKRRAAFAEFIPRTAAFFISGNLFPFMLGLSLYGLRQYPAVRAVTAVLSLILYYSMMWWGARQTKVSDRAVAAVGGGIWVAAAFLCSMLTGVITQLPPGVSGGALLLTVFGAGMGSQCADVFGLPPVSFALFYVATPFFCAHGVKN